MRCRLPVVALSVYNGIPDSPLLSMSLSTYDGHVYTLDEFSCVDLRWALHFVSYGVFRVRRRCGVSTHQLLSTSVRVYDMVSFSFYVFLVVKNWDDPMIELRRNLQLTWHVSNFKTDVEEIIRAGGIHV
jgi:hypothetical protein